MNIKSTIIASFIYLTVCISSSGQSTGGSYSVGIKTGFESFEGVYLEGVDVNFSQSKFLWSLGYNYNRDIAILAPVPRENYRQVNLLFGSFIAKKYFRFEYQAGLGAVWGTRRTTVETEGWIVDKYYTKDFFTAALPIKASVKFVPFKFMSIGLDFLVNLNLERSFSRPMLTLNFGKLR